MTYNAFSGTLNPAPSLAVQGRSDRHAKWRSITYAVDNVTVVVVNIPHGVLASFTVRHAGTAAIPSVYTHHKPAVQQKLTADVNRSQHCVQ